MLLTKLAARKQRKDDEHLFDEYFRNKFAGLSAFDLVSVFVGSFLAKKNSLVNANEQD